MKPPLSAQVKKGLALAFQKFSAYDLAKYDRKEEVKLRDVLFLVHAKPKDKDQERTWKHLVDGTLPIPDTWEVSLSEAKGKDKREAWERLLKEQKLGALATLRNLRNMREAGVEEKIVFEALNKMNVERVLPFRFISAARYAPQWEPQLEPVMFKCLQEHERLPGKTVLLVDVSGSMSDKVSGKSEVSRLDAACGIAILAREICDEVSVYSFSNQLVQIAPRKGFALRDAIVNSQPHAGTYLGQAINAITEKRDRIIVFTDEQSHDEVHPPIGKGYLINVAPYKNGIGYGKWTHIDGFSEATIDFIIELEKNLQSSCGETNENRKDA